VDLTFCDLLIFEFVDLVLRASFNISIFSELTNVIVEARICILLISMNRLS